MYEEWEANLCHNIAWLRQQHGLTPQDMARLLHISVDWLAEIEGGRLPEALPVDILYDILACFGIPFYTQLDTRLGEQD